MYTKFENKNNNSISYLFYLHIIHESCVNNYPSNEKIESLLNVAQVSLSIRMNFMNT